MYKQFTVSLLKSSETDIETVKYLIEKTVDSYPDGIAVCQTLLPIKKESKVLHNSF